MRKYNLHSGHSDTGRRPFRLNSQQPILCNIIMDGFQTHLIIPDNIWSHGKTHHCLLCSSTASRSCYQGCRLSVWVCQRHNTNAAWVNKDKFLSNTSCILVAAEESFKSNLNSLSGTSFSHNRRDITMIQVHANLRHAALTPWKPEGREGFNLF